MPDAPVPPKVARRQLLRRVAIFTTLLSSAAVLFHFSLYEEFGNRPFNDRTFDRNEWLNGSLDSRGRMADDIIKRVTPPGTSRKDVIALLGEPGSWYIDDGIYRYYIGSWFCFRDAYDDAWIALEFDSHDLVKRAYLFGG